MYQRLLGMAGKVILELAYLARNTQEGTVHGTLFNAVENYLVDPVSRSVLCKYVYNII